MRGEFSLATSSRSALFRCGVMLGPISELLISCCKEFRECESHLYSGGAEKGRAMRSVFLQACSAVAVTVSNIANERSLN